MKLDQLTFDEIQEPMSHRGKKLTNTQEIDGRKDADT